jgi:hypothetical protein
MMTGRWLIYTQGRLNMRLLAIKSHIDSEGECVVSSVFKRPAICTPDSTVSYLERC